MAYVQSKTLTPLLILRILEEYSDENHPITREEIERILEDEYGILMERKTFFRHIENLQELDDVDIRRVMVKPKNIEKAPCAGFYIADRRFTDTELRLIIDALSASPYLSSWETEDLAERVARLSSRHFQKKIAAYEFVGQGGKTENETMLLNLEIIDDAIMGGKQIRYDMLHTGNDGKKELSDYLGEVCTPVRYFVREQRYYLVGLRREDGELQPFSLSISDMTNLEITNLPAEDIRSIPEFKNGIDWQKFFREHPVMYWLRGKSELCTFLCARWMVDDIKARFGSELRIRKLSEKENAALSDIAAAKKGWLVEVSVITDPMAASKFAWQNPNEVWLVAPQGRAKELCRQLGIKREGYEKLIEIYGSK